MRFGTAIKASHTFEYWRPIISIDGAGNESIRFEFDSVKTGVLTPQAAGIAQLFTTEQLDIDGEIRSLTDSVGTSVFAMPTGDFEYVMFVATVDPIFDPFGKLVGYKHSLRRSGGTA